MDADSIQQVRDAVQMLREGGHCKCSLSEPADRPPYRVKRHCLIGALIDSGFDTGRNWSDTMDMISQVIREQYPDYAHYYVDPVDWNTEPATTEAEVIAVLEKTAQRMEDAL